MGHHVKRRSAAEILKESADPVVLARDAGARWKCGKTDAGYCAGMTVPELRGLRTRFSMMRLADQKEEIKAELRHGGIRRATAKPWLMCSESVRFTCHLIVIEGKVAALGYYDIA
eukprot:jgi/Mesvir1/18008/Mv09341-RA.1